VPALQGGSLALDASIDLTAAVSPAALTMLRTLSGALSEYLARAGIPLDAVQAHLMAKHVGATDLTAATPGSGSLAAADTEVPPSPYLQTVLALLRHADVFLDVVAAVGRTIEERQLPLLFAAAGAPRTLLREALARASVEAAETAAAVGSGHLLHSAASLRFLRTAAALMLLVQEHAWRQAASKDAAAAKSPFGGEPIGSHADSGAAASAGVAPAAALAIVNDNLQDAADLLGVAGLPHDLVSALVGPPVAPTPIGADAAAAAASCSTSAGELESRLEGLVRGTLCDEDPHTAPALLQLVDSTRAYCARLRGAAEEFCSPLPSLSGDADKPELATAIATTPTTTPMAGGGSVAASDRSCAGAADELQPTEPIAAQASAGRGGWGLFGAVASLFGFGADGPATPSHDEPRASDAAAAPARGAAQQPASTPAKAPGETADIKKAAAPAAPDVVTRDPILRLLDGTSLPLLVTLHATLSRQPGSGSFGLHLGAVSHAPRTPDVPASEGAAASADLTAVLAALRQSVAQQHGWVLAQLLDASAAIEALDVPTSTMAHGGSAPSAHGSALTASGGRHDSTDSSVRARPYAGLRTGDILVRAAGKSLSGLSLDEVTAAVVAAPKVASFTVLRLVPMPVLELMVHLLTC
jgi:hypothetical protein